MGLIRCRYWRKCFSKRLRNSFIVSSGFEEDYDWFDDFGVRRSGYWLIEEPYSEIYDDGKCVKIIIELPPVRKEDVKVKVHGNRIHITATDIEGRDFYKEFILPFELKRKQVKAVLKTRTLLIVVEKEYK